MSESTSLGGGMILTESPHGGIYFSKSSEGHGYNLTADQTEALRGRLLSSATLSVPRHPDKMTTVEMLERAAEDQTSEASALFALALSHRSLPTTTKAAIRAHLEKF